MDYSDGCGSKSTTKFDVYLGVSGRLQTLLHNLCYCLPVVSTTFASLIIYTMLWDGKWGSGGLCPPDVDSIFSKCSPIFCKALCITGLCQSRLFPFCATLIMY